MEELPMYRKRFIEELIEKKLRSTYCVNVIGPKFCGKTTTCEQFAKSKIKLISKDVIDVVRASPQVALQGERLRLIDEWQTVPILWDKIREQADTEETKFGQYLLTGSATPADQEELNHTGSGRIVNVRMKPMSLFESGESKGKVSIKELFDNPLFDCADLNQDYDLEDTVFLMARADVAAGDFSARLCNVVMTCLAVMPENRYQSVDELRTALGWVTTPVISTVIHKPQIAEPPNEYPATVVMSASAAQRAVLAEVVAQPVSPPSPEPAAMGLGSDPDATVISSRARHASPVESFSIDELINAPSAPPAAPAAPKAAIDSAPAPAAKVAPQTRPPQVSTQAKPADAPRSSASGSRMPVIVGALAALGVLGAAGLFMFGSPKTPEPELAITKPEPAPVVVKPADEAAASPSAPVAVAAAAVSEPQAAPAPTQQAAIAPSGVASAAIGASSSALVDTNGSVRVELKGGWGVVFVDGEQKGTVPPVLVMKLAPGSHDLEIRNPAVPTEKRVITVSAGKTTVVRHAFVK
jgi:hypothetical protein